MDFYAIPIWKQAPFFRLVLALILGILLQYYFPLSLLSIFFLSLFFLFFYILFARFSLSIQYRFRFLRSIFLFSLVGLMGMFLIWNADLRHHKDWYGNEYQPSNLLLARIDEPLTEKEHTFKTKIAVFAVCRQQKCVSVKGSIIGYFQKDSTTKLLQYGDVLLIKTKPQKLLSKNNPGSFDYQSYLFFQQVYQQFYLTNKDYVKINVNKKNPLWDIIYDIQTWIQQSLKKYLGVDAKALGIAEALLIGYKNDLDPQLLSAYTNSGVVHIIAISGLHLSLIYFLLGWLLGQIPHLSENKIIKGILLIIGLWFFSLLCGASASVLRSAVMFTCLIVGQSLQRQTSIYNSLASAAFLLLCFNPYYLWDIGFQLSYIAIIGIVVLQKPLQKLIPIQNFFVRKIWEMTSITISAQVFTFPICIYYFHQFPNLFLLTNLIAIPLSSIILLIEIVLLVVSPIQNIAFVVGYMVNKLIVMMNGCMIFFQQLPFAITDHIYANILTTLFLYGMIISLLSFFARKNKIAITVFLLLFTQFITFFAYNSIQILFQKKLIVYNTHYYTAVDVVSQAKNIFITDTLITKENNHIQNDIESTRNLFQIQSPPFQVKKLLSYPSSYQCQHKTILFINDSKNMKEFADSVNIDFLIVCHDTSSFPVEWAYSVKPKQIVLDATNSLWKIAQWKKQCAVLHLPCFSIKDQGAFVYRFQ